MTEKQWLVNGQPNNLFMLGKSFEPRTTGPTAVEAFGKKSEMPFLVPLGVLIPTSPLIIRTTHLQSLQWTIAEPTKDSLLGDAFNNDPKPLTSNLTQTLLTLRNVSLHVLLAFRNSFPKQFPT